jgi:hypothetical protein
MMDYAWGKPAEKVVHVGDENNPIVTEIRRVIIRVGEDPVDALEATTPERKVITH